MLPLCLALAALVALAGGQETTLAPFDAVAYCTALCDQRNGGYFPHPDNCCQYVICNVIPSRYEDDTVEAEVRECHPPTVWNPEKVTCDHPKYVRSCPGDCHSTGTTLEPPTLPPFDEEFACVRDGRIYTRNENDTECYLVDEHTLSVDPEEQAPNCCSGSEFNLVTCLCDESEPVDSELCIICLIFETPSPEVGGPPSRDIINDAWLGLQGTEVRPVSKDIPSQASCFTRANNDSITIPEFSNLYYGPKLAIFFLFAIPADKFEDARGDVNTPKMGLISNGCCNISATIEIWLEGEFAYITFKTEKNDTFVGYNLVVDANDGNTVAADALTDVAVRYVDPILTLDFGTQLHEEIFYLGGDVLTTDCPLTLGNLAQDLETSFEGCLDDFTVCRDVWTDEQVFALQSRDKCAVLNC